MNIHCEIASGITTNQLNSNTILQQETKHGKNWVLAAKRADFQEIGRKYGIDPVIARIIRNRDITEDAEINQYLNGTLDDIPSWKSLKDIDKAVEIISQKIDLGTRMRIIGDYDIDGVTATYILLKGFKRLGANVDTYIPDRIADGYGIHNHLIEKAKEDGVDTIVTCDNGISAADQIAFAKKNGHDSGSDGSPRGPF